MSLAIGSSCPEFDLPGTDGANHSLASFAPAELLVVVVSCNHCPYVVAYEERIVALSRDYAPRGVRLVAINANDVTRYPDDGMPQMKVRARDRGFDFPYLRDDSQTTVRALGARFTPEVYVFDRARKLRYHGRIDDNHRDARAARAHDVRDALDALLAGRAPAVTETQAVGCSVKWR
jgi:thiol-disulfide isomerase/thioredoxin